MARALMLVAMLALLSSPAAADKELNLFDWMGLAPIVVDVEVIDPGGKNAELAVLSVLRGDLNAGQDIFLSIRRTNRTRSLYADQLELEEGRRYLMLLRPAAKQGKKPTFDLVRGVEGARLVPSEGGNVLVDAATILAEIQDAKNESVTWSRMRDHLEERNPELVRTALQHHIKFRRGDADVIGTIRPLLDHPRPDLRTDCATLLAQLLERHAADQVPDLGVLLGELSGKARRDPAVEVRVAATRAIDRIDREGTTAILQEIAQEDPDQMVRFTAEQILYERRLDAAAEEDSTPANGDGPAGERAP